jgi:CubicO group peptidase (beta-lactamase class C family)
MANSFDSGLLAQRVRKAAEDRVDAGIYQTLVIGVVGGQESEVFAFGRLDDGRPPDGGTVYEIASLTKTFTATLLAQAVFSGRVTLDTPVKSLPPDFEIPERNDKKITLEDTATHYSALPKDPANLKPKDRANPFADYDIEKFKAFLAGYELPRDPGESNEYSNLNTGLLGLAMAQSVQTTYDALLAERVLHPLGMTMSGIAARVASLPPIPSFSRTPTASSAGARERPASKPGLAIIPSARPGSPRT